MSSDKGIPLLQNTGSLQGMTNIGVVCLQVDPDGKLDVMVWFHGGGFVSGAGSFYGPEHLLDEDIILVTVNYRLGPIGKFACTSPISA